MVVRKNWLVGLLAFLFLTVNMLAAVPYQAQAASGILFDPTISDFDGAALNVLHDYVHSSAKAGLEIKSWGGLNGGNGLQIWISGGAASQQHRIQGSDITLQSGKTYHMSFWARGGKGISLVAPQMWLGGSKWSGTVSFYGGALESVENGGGCLKGSDFLSADWRQHAFSMNIDHLYTSGNEVTLVKNVEAFMAIFGQDGKNNSFVNPTSIYMDGYYIIEEDTPTSTNYTRAQIANVKVENEDGNYAGSLLTATATIGDANPNAEITLSYQWQSSEDGTTFTDIEGATEATYTAQDADVGHQIRVIATAKSTGTVSGESSMSGTSSAVEVAAAPENVTVTVSAGEGGQVMYNGAAVTGDVTVNSAEDQIFTVVPNDGYEVASILLDEQDVTVAGNEINLKGTTAAKTLAVTFREITPVNPGIAEGATTTQFSADESGKPTMYVYSKLNNFNTAGGNEFGIKLWIKDQPDDKLTLPAMLNSSDKAAAAPGQAFAIRVYGAAITADKTYVAQPYVGSENGDQEEISYK